MINQTQISDEMEEAAAEAIADAEFWAGYWATLEKDSNECAVYRKQARAAIAAALNTWPGMEEHVTHPDGKLIHIILPLPQKGGDT